MFLETILGFPDLLGMRFSIRVIISLNYFVNFETDRAAFKKMANEPWNQPLC